LTTVTVSDTALTHLRFTPNAHWETLFSVMLLARAEGPSRYAYRSWARAATAALGRGEGAQFRDWVATWPEARLPRFLLFTDIPANGDTRPAVQRIAALDPQEVRERLRQEYGTAVPSAFRCFERDPAGALRRFCAGLHDYWECALAGMWPQIAGAVEAEVGFRARTLVGSGVDGLLSSLHTRIHWRRPLLKADTGTDAEELRCSSGLVVVPLHFACERVLVAGSEAGTVHVAYQCGHSPSPGPSPLDTPGDVGHRRLALLLGRSRAAVAQCLMAPTTTTALAGRLALSPSTVSEHLSVLVTARLAVRRRSSNQVFYELSANGRALVSRFSDGIPGGRGE